jgi:hypothetical protein
MRTTLDIDPRVMAAARARARAKGTTIGAEVSELALEGLAAHTLPSERRQGLIVLPKVAGHLVTDEMVAEALLDD